MATGNRSFALREKLRSVFSQARVPTNPAIAMEILRLADDPTSSAGQFAEVIGTDAALAGRLLKMANCAAYTQREPVTTIKRAVTLLGLRRIRMVALGFQLVAHIDRLGDAPFDLKSFWQHSVLRACLARAIAARVAPEHAEEAFVVGLLLDCGILLLVQVLGDEYAHMSARADLSPTAFYLQERKAFAYDHVEAIRALCLEWKLPAAIAEPMARHHHPIQLGPASSPIDRVSAVGYLVGSLPLAAELATIASEPQLRDYAEAQLGLDAEALGECLAAAGAAYQEVAPLVAEQLPEDLDVADLLDRANRHLTNAATDAERRVEAIEAERERMRREQFQLEAALGQYRERAARDPLTGLLNRGALTAATLACIRECSDRDIALAVYFLDIDDFKAFNDELGHHVGDEVIRLLAGVLGGEAINGGFAGRYGGEEFVLVVPALDKQEAALRGRRLVERVRHATLDGMVPVRPVKCSVGAVWGVPGADVDPKELFTAADGLMYQAKLGGKDRCCFRPLDLPGSVNELLPGSGHGGEDDATGGPHLEGGHAPVSPQELRELALQLNQAEPKRVTTMRKRERHRFVVPCMVNGFAGGAQTIRSYSGYLRNISQGGAGVLTTRPMIRGEPVEVAIDPEDNGGAVLYVGGLVAFCRHVRGGIYEIGIQLVAQGRQPILPRDADCLDDQLDWVVESLRAAHDQTLRESA